MLTVDYALEQAHCQAQQIISLVNACRNACLNDDDEQKDAALTNIFANVLSVEIRSGWEIKSDRFEPTEFRILLCTCPAVWITGELNSDLSPTNNCKIKYQGLGELRELRGVIDAETLLEYCNNFSFGERKWN